MPSEFDALVLGSGVAAASAAVALADAGRHVGLVRSRSAPTPPSGLVSGRALARAPPWAQKLPVERTLAGRSLLLLDREAAVTLDYRDASWAASGVRDGLASGSAWTRALGEALVAHGGAVLDVDGASRLDRDGGGGVLGANGHTAPFTLLEGAAEPSATSAPARWWRMRRTYPIGAASVAARLGVAATQGAFLECVLGFLPGTDPRAGYVFPTAESLCVGVTVASGPGPSSPALARTALDGLVAHPAVAPLVAGASASEEVLAPIGIGRSVGRPQGGRGFLALGVPPDGDLATVAGAPSLDRELARGIAAGAATASALAAPAEGAAALAAYRRLVRSLERSVSRSSFGLALHPRAAAGYPGLSAELLHELMHEAGRPKEPIATAVRRVRRGSRRSWLRLSADALELARSL